MNQPVASSESPTGYFPFVERLLIVALGVLLVTVPLTLVEEEFLQAAPMLLVAVLLVFVEGYIVLHTYHERLGFNLDLPLMISNLLIIGLYATVVRYIEASTNANSACGGERCIGSAMIVAVILFVLLFLYQIVLYRNVSTQRLESAGVKRAALVTPMVANGVGIAVCAAVLASSRGWWALPLDGASLIAFSATVLYFFVKYLDVIQIRFGPRPRP